MNRGIIYLCLSILLIAGSVWGQGFIIPRPIPEIPHITPLNVKEVAVKTVIKDQVAETVVDQVFYNQYNFRLEGTYFFPLPEGAAISEFAMFINGEKVQGELLEVEKAREIYQGIVNQMRDPALLEYVGRNLFKASVFPVEPFSQKRIQLKFSQILKMDNNLVKYLFPLNLEKISPQPLDSVRVEVEIKSKIPLTSIYSPSHNASINKNDAYTAKVEFSRKSYRTDKDFQLIYALSEKDIGINLLTHKYPGEDGYFLLMLSPRYDIEKSEILPKDLIFILDTSGSMAGKKIEQAKNALKYGIYKLNEDDRFNIITFATEVRMFEEGLIKAVKDNKKRAERFVEEISAGGGTDINEALKKGFEILKVERGRLQMINFLTDGLPTVGETSVEAILKNIERSFEKKARVFVFGVGFDVNTYLLDLIAQRSNGVAEYVTPEEDIEVKMSSLYDKIEAPVLSDINIKYDQLKSYDVYPSTVSDIFRGSQITIAGRYKEATSAKIELKGKVGEKEKKFYYEVSFPATNEDNKFIPHIWANRKIGYLLEQIRLHGENEELKEEIIKLSKRYGIMTPYTSYLVTEDEKRDIARTEAGERRLYLLKPVPTGIDANIMNTPIGAPAVQMSKDISQLKEGVSEELSLKAVRFVEDRTFVFQDGKWTDENCSKERPKTELKIKFGSEAYFKAIDIAPKLKSYFTLGSNIIICFDKFTLIIGDEGVETLSWEDTIKLQEIK